LESEPPAPFFAYRRCRGEPFDKSPAKVSMIAGEGLPIRFQKIIPA
jgi:hypothetical protein